jgi:hypothetical protein
MKTTWYSAQNIYAVSLSQDFGDTWKVEASRVGVNDSLVSGIPSLIQATALAVKLMELDESVGIEYNKVVNS